MFSSAIRSEFIVCEITTTFYICDTERSQRACKWKPAQHNKALYGFNVRVVFCPLQDCLKGCMDDPYCRSVEYVSRTRRCSMNGKTAAEIRLTAHADFTYYELSCEGVVLSR